MNGERLSKLLNGCAAVPARWVKKVQLIGRSCMSGIADTLAVGSDIGSSIRQSIG